MIRFFRRLSLFSLLFYLVSAFYTRWNSATTRDLRLRALYSLPWDLLPANLFEGEQHRQIQLCVLSQKDVVELLKKNPDNFGSCQLGTKLDINNPSVLNEDYLVIRYKNTYSRSQEGAIKCYISCFRNPLVEYISAPGGMTEYGNIILPFPAQETESQKACHISVRWKNSWGF